MNKVKFLYLLIAILVATNVGVLLFMFSHKPPHPPMEGGPKNEIAHKLNFSPEQVEKYETIIKDHRSSIDKIESEIKTSKNNLFSTLKLSKSTKKDSIITKLGDLQEEIESAHYSHFEKLKAICIPEQMDEFEELTNELGRLFAPPHPPKKK